jgi:predicted 3-demethylubiquinone-9 3-methyltransferase (glyoxalase superfamily)
MPLQKITPFLWFATQAEEAAAFYAGIFPDSRIKRVTSLPVESPIGPPGSVKIVDFELFGQAFVAMSAGELDAFNHAMSFVVDCADQAELDRCRAIEIAPDEPACSTPGGRPRDRRCAGRPGGARLAGRGGARRRRSPGCP